MVPIAPPRREVQFPVKCGARRHQEMPAHPDEGRKRRSVALEEDEWEDVGVSSEAVGGRRVCRLLAVRRDASLECAR
jgi:hypothetical protein